MGQAQSSTCNGLSDQQVLNFVKEYFTMNKMIDILVKVEDNVITSFNQPEEYLVDIGGLIPSGIPEGDPVYQPVMTLIGISDGQQRRIPYTSLHKYNDFILTESQLLSSNDRKIRSKEIRGELFEISKRLLTYITGYCGYVGIKSSE